ncbi:MAG: hypothetical protein JWR69_1664 [Pedosphaera sp.]|nr:hypothetical protein [Pedosphaera sp.]
MATAGPGRTASDKPLVAGGGWGGEELFLANRQSLSIRDIALLADPANYHRLKTLGYTKLVMVSESPLQAATRALNPGEGGSPRETYRKSLMTIVQDWPPVYQDEDILIKELP